MALPTSGQLSLNDIQTEFGGTSPIEIIEYYRGGTYVPDTAANSDIPISGEISIEDFYGGDSSPALDSYSLGYGANSTSACNYDNSGTFYQNSDPPGNFNFNDPLYNDSSGTTFAPSNWYSNGFSSREWSGTSWLGDGSPLC